MSKHSAWFMWTVGFFLVLGGVGAIEQSTTDAAMWDGVFFSVIGLMILGCGTLGMRRLKDNE
jgi:hypothetical protein